MLPLSHVLFRPWRHADKDQLNIANVLPQIFLVWTRLISWSHKRPCLITAHFRWLADTGNGPLVLHPGHPPPPPGPRGRHLHRRGRPLPLDEGDDKTIRRHCPCILFSQVGPLFGVPVDLFSPVENKVTLGPSPLSHSSLTQVNS